MMRFITVALAAAATLALSGCYVTTKPLINAQNAAYPLTATTFKTFSWKDETHDWEQSGSGKVSRVGDHYVMHSDPEAGESPHAGDDMEFMMADLGDHYYAVQTVDKDGDMILLDVVKVDGDTVLEYVMMCEDPDKAFVAKGIIDKFEGGDTSATCTVSSLDQLKRAWQAKVAAGFVPHGKYVKTP